jgi:hypothetical protein
MAQVRVLFAADMPEDDSMLDTLWTTITGSEESGSQTDRPDQLPREVWVMDVPAWQVDRIVKQLRERRFFRRQRELNTDAELATEIDGVRFRKPTSAVAELDSFAERIRYEGRLLNRGGMPRASSPNYPRTLHLPPVEGLNRLPAVLP